MRTVQQNSVQALIRKEFDERITVDTTDLARFPLFFRDSLNLTRLGLA